MPDYIGDLLSPKIIRVTKGTDRQFTLRRTDADGQPVDWPPTVYLSIDIDRKIPTVINAIVTGNLAQLRIEQNVVALVKNTTTWQVVMSEPGTPTLETGLMVGTFQVQNGA